MSSRSAFVLGVAHHLPSDGSSFVPEGSSLPSRLRRGTSVVTRIAADLVRDVAGTTDVAQARFVFGSAWGEVETAWTLLRMRHEHDGALSPARFAASVHSTPLSLLGIALGNRAPSTAVAAGSLTFAMALLEGLAWVDATGPVVVLVADERPPETLASFPARAGGLALVLSHDDAEGRALARIRLERESREGSESALPLACSAEAGIGLVTALAEGRLGAHPVGEGPGERYVAHLDAVRRNG